MMRLAALGLCAAVASAQDDGNQDLIAQVRTPHKLGGDALTFRRSLAPTLLLTLRCRVLVLRGAERRLLHAL